MRSTLIHPVARIAAAAVVSAFVLASFAACGGATVGAGEPGRGDAGGRDSRAGNDAGHEDAPGSTGCVADPVANEACDPSVPACTPGNVCCNGEWVCRAANPVWVLEQGECACFIDAGAPPTDAGRPAVDATAIDASLPPTTCAPPSSPDGGQYLGCQAATCPAGTVCVQRDADVTSTAMCVSIPAACQGTPTCACMEAEAQQCVAPGTPPQTDATPSFLDCQDETSGGQPYLDFPCGCA